MKPIQHPVSFIDNPLAPELFAGNAAGFLLINGNVHITLTAPRPDHDPNKGNHPINVVVVGRLVMPLNGAQGLITGLYEFLKQRGHDPLARAETGARVQ